MHNAAVWQRPAFIEDVKCVFMCVSVMYNNRQMEIFGYFELSSEMLTLEFWFRSLFHIIETNFTVAYNQIPICLNEFFESDVNSICGRAYIMRMYPDCSPDAGMASGKFDCSL